MTITRTEWSWQFDRCFACNQRHNHAAWWMRLQTHEIARGPAKQAAMKEPAAWLRVCRQCHDAMDDYSKWPIARQLALKKLRDPEHYDRVKVNELRGEAPESITEEEVDEWVEKMRSEQA